MNSSKYEQLVSELAGMIASGSTAERRVQVNYGTTNLIKGASAYSHQIDVTVQETGRLLLIECKCWNKKVDPEAVLAFAARVLDIRAAEDAREVTGRLVTTVGATDGVDTLCKYFGIDVDNVTSEHEYALRSWSKAGFGSGVVEQIVASDECSAVHRRADGSIIE